MNNKVKKICANEECKKEFETTYTKKIYCSYLCYYNNRMKRQIEQNKPFLKGNRADESKRFEYYGFSNSIIGKECSSIKKYHNDKRKKKRRMKK